MQERRKWWAAVTRVFLWLLVPSVVAAMQLPPEIQADRYLLEAEKQIQEQDYKGAKESLDRILALEAQHGLEIPAEFFFRYAEVLERLALYDEAVEAVTKYLALAGRGGQNYREALELLSAAEEAKAAAVEAAEAAKKRAAAAKAAADEARRRAAPVVSGMEFVWVPAGEFRMGSKSSEAESDEQPLTRVRISRGFYLGKYEVTQAEWQAVMGSNPSPFDECGPNCPVEKVSWIDVQKFIAKLNAWEGRQRYRLPTEAEWEYAARAGTSGDRYGNVDVIAWYKDNSGGRLHPVGGKAPNAWGLHDMLGNVWEWVEDRYCTHPGGSVTDPQGPCSHWARVYRSCSPNNSARNCRAPERHGNDAGSRTSGRGFRLLRTE